MSEERLGPSMAENEDSTRPNHGPTQVRELTEQDLGQIYRHHAPVSEGETTTKTVQILTLPSESGDDNIIYPPQTQTIHIMIINGGMVREREISLRELGLQKLPDGTWDPDRWLERIEPTSASKGKLQRIHRVVRRLGR